MQLFVKVLTPIEVERRLILPRESLPALPRFEGSHEHEIMLQVKDDVGNLRKFCCKKRYGGGDKLVIETDWIQFVNSEKLRPGDVVAFYKEDDRVSGTLYRIEVKRRNDRLGLIFVQSSILVTKPSKISLIIVDNL
ncbi:hypothetical protein CXB51_033941 [Gossypium anomalum]|uniref:TF-B3 domain-containing protein n=1 Tax=Gossypium anomalum TaxID=47600 RepID=A0A8J6CGG2_9ROSI|nr:hypothetical protein CXB51_033941 [Gossypium anomalum]